RLLRCAGHQSWNFRLAFERVGRLSRRHNPPPPVWAADYADANPLYATSRVMALAVGLREILAQLLLSDGLAMDLVGPVRKAQHPRACIGISQVKILADASAATHLDGAVDDLLRYIGCDDLDHGNLGACGLVADRVHHVGGVERQQARLVDLDAGLSDPVARHAVVRNGPAEGAATDGALTHLLQRALGDTDQPHAMMDAAGAEPPLRDFEAAAFAEQDVRRRHANVLEHNFGVAVRRIVIAEEAERALDLHARRVERHQHHGLAFVGLRSRIRHAHHDRDFAAAVHGARGPPFAAVNDVVVVVAPDFGPDGGGVRGRHPP